MGPGAHVPALAPPLPWMSSTESHKAWMTFRDADLLELLLVAHSLRIGSAVDVLEWGAGRSTLWYSSALERQGLLDSWLALEHNREFFMGEIAPQLTRRSSASYLLCERLQEDLPALAPAPAAASKARATLRAVVFDAGDLRPFDPDRDDDRRADLDDYVALPASLDRRFDIVVVDGRKRRRCLLEASSLLTDSGIVVLHDAWRSYYQCAFDTYPFAQRIGDELWVGAQRDPDLGSILPRHAFEHHADDG
jgi:Methyltransferase domain